MRELFAGIDLAWSTGVTGIAVVDDSGRVLSSGRVGTDDEIAAWLGAVPGQLVVVAVDAPLVVPNETGQRLPERLIGQAFSAFGASAHSSNRGTFGGREARAMILARRFGWVVDPDAVPGGRATTCIEVYPHPALIGLFDLPYRLDYKKGATARRLPGFRSLVRHVESIPELGLVAYPRWIELKRVLASPKPGDLNRWEDEVDAILCAHLAWLWRYRPASLQVYGTAETGYIVAPPPPMHRPAQPKPGTVDKHSEPAHATPPPDAVDTTSMEVRTPDEPQSPTGRRPRPRHPNQRAERDTRELRALLIERIRSGEGPVTYAHAAARVGRIANGLGPVLSLLEQDCATRGEPNLAVLVVSHATGAPTKYATLGQDWVAEQHRCTQHAWTPAHKATFPTAGG